MLHVENVHLTVKLTKDDILRMLGEHFAEGYPYFEKMMHDCLTAIFFAHKTGQTSKLFEAVGLYASFWFLNGAVLVKLRPEIIEVKP